MSPATAGNYRADIKAIAGAVVIAVTTTVASITWVERRIESHSAHPHPGALSHREFQIFVEQMVDRLERLEDAIRGVRQ